MGVGFKIRRETWNASMSYSFGLDGGIEEGRGALVSELIGQKIRNAVCSTEDLESGGLNIFLKDRVKEALLDFDRGSFGMLREKITGTKLDQDDDDFMKTYCGQQLMTSIEKLHPNWFFYKAQPPRNIVEIRLDIGTWLNGTIVVEFRLFSHIDALKWLAHGVSVGIATTLVQEYLHSAGCPMTAYGERFCEIWCEGYKRVDWPNLAKWKIHKLGLPESCSDQIFDIMKWLYFTGVLDTGKPGDDENVGHVSHGGGQDSNEGRDNVEIGAQGVSDDDNDDNDDDDDSDDNDDNDVAIILTARIFMK